MTDVGTRIPLPEPVARIYEAVEELERVHPGRKFTPDGHLVGSIGEVIAEKAFGLTLRAASYPGHDAVDEEGRDVQIKLIGPRGKRVSMYATSVRLLVLQIVSPQEAEVVYDGPGEPAWSASAPLAKNGQRSISITRLRGLGSTSPGGPLV